MNFCIKFSNLTRFRQHEMRPSILIAAATLLATTCTADHGAHGHHHDHGDHHGHHGEHHAHGEDHHAHGEDHKHDESHGDHQGARHERDHGAGGGNHGSHGSHGSSHSGGNSVTLSSSYSAVGTAGSYRDID